MHAQKNIKKLCVHSNVVYIGRMNASDTIDFQLRWGWSKLARLYSSMAEFFENQSSTVRTRSPFPRALHRPTLSAKGGVTEKKQKTLNRGAKEKGRPQSPPA